MNGLSPIPWLKSLFQTPKAAPPPAPAATPEPMPAPEQPHGLSFFRLQSVQGHYLSLPPGATHLTRKVKLDPDLAMIAMVPIAHPYLCLIAAPDSRPFSVLGDPLTGIASSARLLPTNRRGIVRLKQPLGGMRFLTVADDRPHAPITELRFDGAGFSMAAAFALLPLADADLPPRLRGMAAAFGAAMAAGPRQAPMIEALRMGRVPAGLADPILRLLPRDELSDLARSALEQPDILHLLRRLMPDGPFITALLPALSDWAKQRPPIPGGQTNSPASDEALLAPSLNLAAAPLGLALHTLARSHVAPRRGLCILATARNEGPYLLDWLAYHLSIGVEHIFLYTNDNADGSDALLALLAGHGIITLVRNERGPDISVQDKAYAHALTMLPQILDFRWTAILDIDEYLAFDTAMFDTIGDFIALQEAQPVDAVALSWVMFAARIGQPYAEGLTPHIFTRRAANIDSHVKTLCRTRQFCASQPHYPFPTLDGAFLYRTQDGSIHHHPGVQDRIPAFAAKPGADQAWINHYILRTAPEALWKLSRGRADWLPRDGETKKPWFTDFIATTFLDLARPENLVSDRRILGCAHRQAAMLETLLALPGVAACNATIQANFSAALQDLAARFLATPPPHNAAASLIRFREAVAAAQGNGTPPSVVSPVQSPMM